MDKEALVDALMALAGAPVGKEAIARENLMKMDEDVLRKWHVDLIRIVENGRQIWENKPAAEYERRRRAKEQRDVALAKLRGLSNRVNGQDET